jgi:hypothetical protein
MYTERNYNKVKEVLQKIEDAGVPCCFFKHSKDAILHSKSIGLISQTELSGEQAATIELSKQQVVVNNGTAF